MNKLTIVNRKLPGSLSFVKHDQHRIFFFSGETTQFVDEEERT